MRKAFPANQFADITGVSMTKRTLRKTRRSAARKSARRVKKRRGSTTRSITASMRKTRMRKRSMDAALESTGMVRANKSITPVVDTSRAMAKSSAMGPAGEHLLIVSSRTAKIRMDNNSSPIVAGTSNNDLVVGMVRNANPTVGEAGMARAEAMEAVARKKRCRVGLEVTMSMGRGERPAIGAAMEVVMSMGRGESMVVGIK